MKKECKDCSYRRYERNRVILWEKQIEELRDALNELWWLISEKELDMHKLNLFGVKHDLEFTRELKE